MIEKTPGVDDVFVITLDNSTRIQVDGPIYEAVVLDHLVRKDAWSQKLETDGKLIDLEWSPDFKGMLWAMPSILSLFVMLGIVAIPKSSPINSE